ncbi:MAG: PQQ-binding-like beta-propeller repeat protein [Labilithrix sp.]|nr:PQQ-binding-like beta-propeller repeat protein [Labilithrix sp.]MCW5815499.1 PQQ-binding-like beta-propeller repeat protein [Labilithrix sp.]
MNASKWLSAAFIVGLVACGGDQLNPKTFSTDWVDDQGKSIGEVYSKLREAKPGPGSDIAVAVTQGNKIVGTPLGDGEQWTVSHALDSRPVIAGSVVVLSGGNEVACFDAQSGKKLWARPTGGLPLLGAGDDGAITAVTLQRGGGSTLLIVGRDGSVKRQIETDKQIGAPAVLGGVVFVPWANQYVSAIDAASGDEIGRVTLRDKVSRALMIGEQLYFAEHGFVRFDEKISLASRGQANKIPIPTRELPGTPRAFSAGTEKTPVVANARDRDRLYARPDSEKLALDSGRFYATYYRLIFGFATEGNQLAWVRHVPSDVIGGRAAQGGVILCDEEGKITVLDAKSGQVALEKQIGQPIKSCTVRADHFRTPRASAAGPSLGQQITDAVTVREATLATAQRLLIRELATIPDDSATKTLIDIASDPRSVPVLVEDARTALAARRNGQSHMVAALSKHYDYLHDVLRSPPVGPIADALAAMKDPNAAPLIAAHLFDPAITDDDVKRAAAALAVIATPKELPQLKQFFAMYRGTAASDEVGVAVGSVAEAMLRLDPKGSRPIIEAAAKDAMTKEAPRAKLEQLLSASGGGDAKPADKK